jgi:hypothetical protein
MNALISASREKYTGGIVITVKAKFDKLSPSNPFNVLVVGSEIIDKIYRTNTAAHTDDSSWL